jgi:hypothetical protein
LWSIVSHACGGFSGLGSHLCHVRPMMAGKCSSPGRPLMTCLDVHIY